MEKDLKIVKILLYIEIAFGVALSLFIAVFVGTMATDSPSSTYIQFIFGALFGGFTPGLLDHFTL